MEELALNYDDCETRVLDIFKRFCPNFGDRTFTSVHRLGRKQSGKCRPVIACFHHFKDKTLIQKHASDILKNHSLRLSDDYPFEIEKARKQLYPIYRAAQQLHIPGAGEKPKLIAGKLFINGKTYDSSNINQLPDNLQPQYIYTPSRHGITAFYTMNSPLSNHYRNSDPKSEQFNINGQKYNCMEQFFMASKASEFGDAESVMNIMKECDPVKMKGIGRKIQGYDDQHWMKVCEERLMVGLLEKFRQNSNLKNFILATGDDELVEASTNTTWGIGITLRSKDLFSKGRWAGKNIMGKLLMKARDLLMMD